MKRTNQFPDSSGIASGYIDIYPQNALLTSHEVHDFGSGGTFGSILQTTTNTYSGLQLSETKVTDANANMISDVQYTWSIAATATTGTPQRASSYSKFGNIITVKRWVSGSIYQTSSSTYFDTGNVQTATDVNGEQTTYTYGGCGNSFPTSVTSQTGGSVITSLTTSATWNCNGGVPLTNVDVNGNTTTYSYGSDPYWRPTSITNNATSQVTNMSYPSSSSSFTTSSMTFGSSTSTSVTGYDSLGRPNLQQSLGVSNYDTVATAYDSRGRIASATLPYSGTLGSYVPSNPGTSTTYDALNRIYTVTDSGGGTKQYNFSSNGNDLLVTIGPQVTLPSTENLKKRNFEYNGAGWLTSVCEVVSTTQPAGGACGQAIGYTGYLTKYTYDGGGRLTKVQQNAQSSSTQTRTVSYDGLGRKVSETIPEWSAGTGAAGSATYAYDSDSSGSCSGSYPGDLVKSVDNMGNVTCFTYDLLHRRLSSTITSSSPYYSVTPNSYFVYDSASYNGSGMQNALGNLAEAYTCSGSCGSKQTDEFFSAVTSGSMSGGVQAQMWESTPHSGGYFFTQEDNYPNGTVGAISASLVGAPPGSTTNLITDSAQVGNGSWGPYCAGNTNGMVVDTTAVSAPDGSNSATQFTMPSSYSCGSSNPWGALTVVQAGLTAGQTYTVSAWLRGAAGGESVSLGLNDCATTGVTLSNSWQRYSVTYSSISSGVANCSNGSRGFEFIGSTANSTFYIWGPQTVEAATAEPYVATTDGAATYIGIPNLTFGVDSGGRPNTASDGTNNLVISTTYYPGGLTNKITYGNAASGSANDFDQFTYDSADRPYNLTYSISPSSGTYTVSTALTWNANGSLQRMVYTDGSPNPMSQNCTYSADDLSRIASVDCGSSAWGQNFSYDAFGNIQKSVPAQRTGTTYQTGGYSAITNQAVTGATYDKNGNQLTSTPAMLAWNAWNEPVTVNGTSATYDALGRMVEKGSGSTYTQFVYRPSGAKLAIYSGGLVKGTVPLPGGSTAIYNSSGLNYIRHTDWLGSSRLATTWTHTVYSKEAYAPFGETYNESGTPDRSFTGQDQDVTTGSGGGGEYDFLFRKYDPSAGRWLSPDPAGWAAVAQDNPQTFDRYSYVLNNPMSLTDIYGLDCAYQNDDGGVTMSPGDCPTDASGNPTDNGFYIDATGVTTANFDDNGDLVGYAIGTQMFNVDGTQFTPDLVTTGIGFTVVSMTGTNPEVSPGLDFVPYQMYPTNTSSYHASTNANRTANQNLVPGTNCVKGCHKEPFQPHFDKQHFCSNIWALGGSALVVIPGGVYAADTAWFFYGMGAATWAGGALCL